MKLFNVVDPLGKTSGASYPAEVARAIIAKRDGWTLRPSKAKPRKVIGSDLGRSYI